MVRRYWNHCIACLLMIGFAANVPAQESASRVAKYMPGQNLVFFMEFDGLKAHSAAWQKTDLYNLLNKTSMRLLLDDLTDQIMPLVEQNMGDNENPALTKDLFRSSADSILQEGFGVSVHWKPGPADPEVVFVLPNLLKNASLRKALQDQTEKDVKKGEAKVEKKGSRQIITPTDAKGFVVIIDGDDLVFMKTNDGSESFWNLLTAQTHPKIQALAKSEKSFKPALRALVDVSAIPMPPEARQLGLNGLKQIDFRFGFEANQLRTDLKVTAPAPRQGLLALMDTPALNKASLAVVPGDTIAFTAVSFDAAGIFTKATKIAASVRPGAEDDVEQFLGQFRQNPGVDLKKYFFDLIGPTAVFGTKKAAAPNASGEYFVSVEVRDPQALAMSFDRLIPLIQAMANATIEKQGLKVDGPVEIKRQKSGTSTRNWVVNLPNGLPLDKNLKPTIRIGERSLVVAMNAKTVNEVVAVSEGRGKKFEFAGPFAELAPHVPANLVFMQVSGDNQALPTLLTSLPAMFESFKAQLAAAGEKQAIPITINPKLIPNPLELQPFLKPGMMTAVVDKDGLTFQSRDSVPSVSGVGVGAVMVSLMLPAVQSAREAARRTQCVNNLKQIGLGMHNYHATFNAFPKNAITDKEGHPLLSWRVAILPYIEQEPLYRKFHLNEPWDSPHNKALISEMPKIYACPSHPLPPGMTTYKVPVGKGTMFEAGKATAFKDILDGMANTLMVVESSEPVEWTKPADLDYDPADPTNMLGSKHPEGFNSVFADGAVRFLRLNINIDLLKGLFTKDAGEVLSSCEY